MRPKSTGYKLPPRMIARKRTLKSGKVWTGYYYNGRDDDGKRVEIPLGTDLAAAKRKWAELEKSGYALLARMHEPVPDKIELKERQGLWNWDLKML